MAHQIIPRTSPLKDQLQPVLDRSFKFLKIQATATTVQSFFGLVQFGLQSFCSPRTGLLNTIENDPNVYPTIRLFELVQLCTINRYHEQSVVQCDCAIINALQVSAATKYVIVCINKTILGEKCVQYLLCLVCTVRHFVCAFRMLPEGLELGANGNGMKHRTRAFVSSILLQLIKAWLTTLRTGIEICIRTNESNTRLDAHMTDNGHDASEIT